MNREASQKRREYWSSVATDYAKTCQRTESRLYAKLEADLLIEFTQPDASQLILDVCSGAGRNTIALAYTGAQVYGVDLADNMVKVACEKARAGKYDNITFLQGNVMELPFADGTFDSIIGTRFMYMIFKEDRKKLIRELRRVLKPGGVLALQFNGGLHGLKNEILGMLRGKKPRLSGRYLWPGQARYIFEGMQVEHVIGIKLPRLALASKIIGKPAALFFNRLVRAPGLGYLTPYLLVKAVKR